MVECDMARVTRESFIYEARAAAERNIARMHRDYGEELDDEEVSKQLLSIEDTRPFNYSLDSVMGGKGIPVWKEHPPRLPPSSHREKLASCFKNWCDKAAAAESDIKSEQLPLMFRFALQRPLMPERTLRKTLKEFGIDPTLNFLSDMRVEHTVPYGRSRRTMYGLDPERKTHVSSKYRDIFPTGLGLPDDENQQPEEGGAKQQDASKGTQTCGIGAGWRSGPRRHHVELNKHQLHECLWSLYDLVQDGLIDSEEAPGRYRHVLCKLDLSNFELMLCLRALGLPTHHIQNADIAESTIASPGADEKCIMREITDLVELHISGGFSVAEVLALIKEALIGLPFDVPSLYKVVQDHSGDAASVAERIWEETAGRNVGAGQNPSASKDQDLSSQPVSAEFEEICKSVLGADLTAEDVLAMLKAAMGEHELSNAQKSHIISKLDPSQTAIYHRVFEINAAQIEDSGRSQAATQMRTGKVMEDFQLFPSESCQDSQVPDLGTASTAGSFQELPHTLPLETNTETLGTVSHPEEHLISSLPRYATENVAADKRRDVAHINALNDRTEVLPTTEPVDCTRERLLKSGKIPTLLMPPPTTTTPVTRPTKESPDTSRSVPENPETPIPVPVELDKEEATDGAWKPYLSDDDIYDSRCLSSSPETGMTCDLFGLSLRTSKARELGMKIGLSSDYVHNQIHSNTSRRLKAKKLTKASMNVTFTSRKRKASNSIDGSHCAKSRKYDVFSNFAQDDEDHEEFVHGYFMGDVLQDSKHHCLRCQRSQCACKKRKRSPGSEGVRNRKKQTPLAPALNVPLDSTKRSISDSTSSAKSGLSSTSLAMVGGEKHKTKDKPVPPMEPAKLRLNPPKPFGQPDSSDLQGPPKISNFSNLPSSLNKYTSSGSPNPSILAYQLSPPKALVSHLKREIADWDIMESLKRLLAAETPEGRRLYQLVDHALRLISEKLCTEGPRFFDSQDRSQVLLQTLRHLVEAELLAKQREKSNERSSASGAESNGTQKTSMLSPPIALSIVPQSSPSSTETESQSEVCSGSKAQLENVSETPAVRSEIIPSIKKDINPDSGPITQDKTDSITLPDICSSKGKKIMRRSKSRRPRMFGRERAPRKGQGFHPCPERGISTKEAINKAHEEAIAQRKGIFLYMAERRLIRPRANQSEFDRFYQGGTSSKPPGGAGATSSLNKLFDKYRGISTLATSTK